MAELFVELFSEEIPSILQVDARRKIKLKIEERLQRKEIKFKSSKSFSTPKRLVFFLEGISEKINPILRKIVSTKEGTAGFANVPGYEVGGKTGTAQQAIKGGYSKVKINTFVAIFPTSKPKYVLLVLLEDPKLSKNYVYNYRNKKGSYTGTPFNTAGWTTVEIAGKIIEKIGPILATKYIEAN